MLERRAVNPSEVIKKERLSDEEMGNLISALGNHEAKAITLCAMTPGIIYSRSDLYRAIIQAQGQNIGWRIARPGPFKYCEYSLSPIGLVTHEAINPDLSTYGYVKTDYGEKIGVPLAGLLLDFSLRHPDFSLQDFFASTLSASPSQEIEEMEYKKRAPGTRLKIFLEILTSSPPIRTKDIANEVQMGYTSMAIGAHLFTLAENGIISYEAVKAGEPRIYYRLSETPPPSEPEPHNGMVSLTSFVYQLLKKDGNREWFAEAIAEQYRQYLKTNNKSFPKEGGFRKRISAVLSHLAKNGYARRRKFSWRKSSEVTLTEEQRRVLLDLVTLLDRFQNQDPAVLELGKRLASGIIANSEKVSLLLAKAKEHSKYTNELPVQETADDILGIISSRPGSTNRQIQEMLKQKEERKLSKPRVTVITNLLIAEGKIIPTTIRGVRHFTLMDKPGDPSPPTGGSG